MTSSPPGNTPSPIPSKAAPKKLWKHFYNPTERWDRLCDVNINAWRQEAEGIIGYTRETHDEPPQVSHKTWARAKPLFREHHESGYMPVYMSELEDEHTRFAPSNDDSPRTIALTPRALYIVIDNDSNAPWVVTAYRPYPYGKRFDWDEDDFQRVAAKRFQNNTMSNHTYTATVASWLERANKPASTTQELWRLAFSVAQARTLAEDARIATLLAESTRALEATPRELFIELGALLDFGTCIEQLSLGLEQERPEDFEQALEGAEELLVVAEVIGAHEKSTHFIEDIEAIIPWVPAEWSHLRVRARNHAAMLDAESGARRLWELVEDCVIAACVMEGEPAVKPTPHLYKKLLPAASPWAPLLEQLSRLTHNITKAIETPLSQLTDSFQVMQPAPLMGSTLEEQRELRAHMPTLSPELHARIFVVDEEHPEGFDVTEYIGQTSSHFWTLDNDERALVVFILSEAPIALGASLDELVALAREREDMALATREV